MLTLADVPASALAALQAAQPSFTPWDTSNVTAAARAKIHTSPNERIVVIRGNFRGAGVDDYVIAGRTSHRPMMVALLVQPDSSYDVSVVTEGGSDADSSSGEPPVLLECGASQYADAKPGALDMQ